MAERGVSGHDRACTFDWEDLVAQIVERRVVPVIGWDAIQVPDACGAPRSFDRVIAACVSGADAASESLSEACTRVAREAGSQTRAYRLVHESVRQFRDTIEVPDTLRRLASVRDFSLFVTTTFDDLLERAIQSERGDCLSLAHSIRRAGAVEDLPSGPITHQSVPVVYHLFGRSESIPSFAVTDEDVLEFLSSLHAPGRPARLFDCLRERCLLLLGCRYPDWLMRVLLRLMKDQPLSRRATEEFFVAPHGDDESSLVAFLSSCGTQIVGNYSISGFMEELHRRWQAATPSSPSAPLERRDPQGEASGVFLSYASEDRVLVMQLATRLEKLGVPVWVDQRSLQFGERWCRAIQDAISRSRLFIPVLTANSRQRTKGYFHYEWALAEEERRRFAHTYKFILPLHTSDVALHESWIPPSFREVHGALLQPNGCIDDAIADVIKDCCGDVERTSGSREVT